MFLKRTFRSDSDSVSFCSRFRISFITALLLCEGCLFIFQKLINWMFNIEEIYVLMSGLFADIKSLIELLILQSFDGITIRSWWSWDGVWQKVLAIVCRTRIHTWKFPMSGDWGAPVIYSPVEVFYGCQRLFRTLPPLILFCDFKGFLSRQMVALLSRNYWNIIFRKQKCKYWSIGHSSAPPMLFKNLWLSENAKR